MWSGQYSRSKKQSLSGNKAPTSTESRSEILERTRRERAERLISKRRDEAAVVIQKVWRAWWNRKVCRLRWMHTWHSSGQRAGLRVLVAAVDADVWHDVVLFAEEVRQGFAEETLGQVQQAIGVSGHSLLLHAPQESQDSPNSQDSIASYMLFRDVFQLCLRCLAAHSNDRLRCVRQMTLAELQRRAGESEEFQVANVLLGIVLKVLGMRSMAWLGVSMQLVCLREMTWFWQDGGTGATDAGMWVKKMNSRVVQDVIDILGGSGEDVASASGASPRACVAETLGTAALVCLFSGSTNPLGSLNKSIGYHMDRNIARDSEIFRFVMGVPSLFSRCPSMVPLAEKIWSSAIGCIGMMLQTCESGDSRMSPTASPSLPKRATLADIIPRQSMEPLLVNLVHCVQFMHAQGRFGDASRESIMRFIALLDVVFEDGSGSHSSRKSWSVSVESFVHPLAEADVIAAMASTLLAKSGNGNHGLEGLDTAKTLCSFVHRLLTFSGSAMVQTKVLLTLAVKANIAGLLWSAGLKDLDVRRGGPDADAWLKDSTANLLPTMILFSESFAMSLNVLGDEGFYNRDLPIGVDQVYSDEQNGGGTSVLGLLKALLWQIVWYEKSHSELSLRFLKAGGKLLTLLHDRNGRRPFAPHNAFYATSLPRESFHAAAVAAIGRGDIEKMHMEMSGDVGDPMDLDEHGKTSGYISRNSTGRVVDLLQHLFPLVPFLDRVRVFQSIVEAERITIGDQESMSGVFFGGLSRERFVTVQRGRVLEDAYGVLGKRKSSVDVKKRIRISFINEFGEQEAGIDGGGVFKEFLESVIRESVAPDKGLFMATTDNKLYPAPTALLTRDQLNLVEFVGMMIGKALWEGILLELPLASFFLKKIRGAVSGVDDLPSLDPEMAKNLSYLAQNPDSVGDMGLTFSISVEDGLSTKDVDLVPGGSSIPVTASNVAHFIHRMANFKLNEQIKASCDAFLNGFHAIVPQEWVQPFNDAELQMLIGGAEGNSRIDIADLQRHVRYTGGYDEHHPTICNLWHVLGGMSNSELADFLRFVTSCPRPPILGFGSLQPPLTIQMIESVDRLPTAATCVNLLKLPAYVSANLLREKLSYAISSHAGFDLS